MEVVFESKGIIIFMISILSFKTSVFLNKSTIYSNIKII